MPYNYSQDERREMELEIGYDLRACLTYNTSEYLTPTNIKRIVAVYEGENDRTNWRWIIERTFAWLGNYRRLTVRWDRSLTIYNAFFQIACFMIVIRRVLK